MSSNRINVNLAFSAETGKAKQQIQELQTLLSKIAYQGATTSSTDKLSTDLHQASEAAKELQFHLNNAFNATTGNFDLSLLDKSLKTSNSNITDLSTKLLSAGQTGQQAFLKLAQSISMADQPMFKINSKLKELGVSIKNAARWQISSNIIHGLQGGIQSAYNYAQDLNKSLNNIRIVTGYNTDKMAEFAEQANKAAKALSTTTTDYTDASLIYFQQGLSDAEVQGRTDTTIKLANVTGQSVEETANQMTAIWNNFDDGSKSLDYYADVITALGAATASSSKEISEGLNKFSAIAESVGLSYEYASAALATVTATTRQSADVVGNSFKTLFARIQGLNLGETLDDGTTLNKYSEALFKVGINVKDQSGQLKDMNTILDEMGSKWNTLSKDQQVALAQTVGGVRQYTQLIALMDNWDYFQQNLGVATGAEGTLNKQAEIYAESWEAAGKRVQAAAEGIYQSLLDDKFFISINNGFANLLGGLDAFIDGAGGLKTVLIGLAGIALSTFAHQIPDALKTLRYNLELVTKNTKNIYKDIQDEMNSATKMAFKGFTADGEKVTPIKEDSSLGYQIQAANELTAARSKLAVVSDKMSNSEKQYYSTQLDIIQSAQNEVAAIKKKNEALQESINLQKKNLQKSDTNTATDKVAHDSVQSIAKLRLSYEDEIAQMQENINYVENLIKNNKTPTDSQYEEYDTAKEQIQNYQLLSSTIQDFHGIVQDAAIGMQDFHNSIGGDLLEQITGPDFGEKSKKVIKFPNELLAGFEKLSLQIEGDKALDLTDKMNIDVVHQELRVLESSIDPAIRKASGLQNAFDKVFNSTEPKELQTAFKQLVHEMGNCEIQGKDFKKVLEGLYGKSINLLINDVEQLRNGEQDAAQQADILKKLLNEFNPQHVVRTSEALGALGGLAANSVSTIATLISAIKNIGNPELSGWERFSALISGIGMSIPQVLSLLQDVATLRAFSAQLIEKENAALTKQAILNSLNNAESSSSYKSRIKDIKKLLLGLSAENKEKLAGVLATAALENSENKLNKTRKDALIKQIMSITGCNKEIAAKLLEAHVNKKVETSLWGIAKARIAAMPTSVKIILAVVAALAALVAVFSALYTSQKEANKAIAKSTEKYEEQKSKLDELKNELQSVNDQIAELNSQDQLDIVSQAELDKLEARRASLEAQVALQERLAAAAQREQANTISENWDKSSDLTPQPSQKGVIKGTDWVWTDGDSRPVYTQLTETLDQYQKRVGYNPETGEFDANRNYTDDQIAEMTTSMQQWEIDNQAQMDKWRSDNQKQYLQNEADYDAIVAAAQAGNYTWKQDEKEQMQSDLAGQRKAMYGEDYDDLFIRPLLNAAEQVSIAKGEDGKYSVTGISQEEMDLHGISQGELDTWLNDQITANSEAKLKSIQDLDFSKLTSDQLFLLFDNLEQLEHFNGSSMEELIAYLTEIQNIEPPEFDVDSWKTDYSKKMDIIKDLETGDSIAEDYALLGEEYQQYFQVQTDGTAILTAKAEDLLATVQQIEIGKLTGEIKQAQDRMHGYNTDENGKLVLDNRYMSTTNARGALDSHNAGWSYRDQGLIDYTSFVNEQYEQSFNTSSIEGWEQAIAYMEQQNALLEEQQELLAETATSQDQLNQYLQQGLITEKQYNDNFTGTIIKEAQSINIDVDELMAYADYLQQINPDLKDNIQLTQKMALQYLKTQKGVKKMTDSFDDWSDAIKNGNKDVVRYAKTMDEIKDAYKDVFNTIDPKVIEDLNNEFLASPKMMSLMERALGGDEQAWNDWEAAVLAEINNTNSAFSYMTDDMKNQMTELTTMAANLDFSGLTPGADIQDEAFISKLAQMEFATAEAAQAMSDNLSSVGVDAEIVPHERDVEGYTAETKQSGSFSFFDEANQQVGTISFEGGATETKEPHKETFYTLEGATYNGRGVRPGGVSSNKGGGGGGGGSKPKHAEKKNDSDKTRYHTLQNQLEDLRSEYDSISEAADRAFGKEKLKAIDDEINKTDELINKQEEYLDAIKKNLPIDKAVMDAYYTDLIGGTIKYDERGNISNYDQIQDAMFAKYNKMADRYDEDSEEWQVFEKKYEQLEKYIEQYEETYDLLRDEETEYQDLLRQRIDLQLEKVQYSIEIQLEVPENEIAIIEYQLGRIEDDAFKSAEAIGLLTKKAENIYDQIQVNKQGLNDLLELSLSTQEIIQLMNGDMSVLEGKTFTEDQIDAIKDYRDNLLDLNEEFDDIRENIEEQVMEVFDTWNEKLEQGIDKLDHYGNVLESYKNIIDIVGKDTLGLSDAFMATLNQSSIDNAINKVTATKKSYEAMIDAQSQAEQALEEAKARNDEASIKMWEENLQSITEEAQSAREEMLSAWEDALDGIAEQFEATVERVVDIFNKEIYTLGGLEGLSEDFSRQQENADIMLDDYQKIYELSKLNRDINKSIDDTDSISGKQKLKKLLEQINKLQEDGVEMSQYDLEYMQKTYDLRMAEIELEEAQRAKNTVRLRKDNEGNWSYVYTQNMDAVDTAQQKYEDALYAMQDVSSNYIDEMSEKLISTSQEMEEALAAIRIQDYANIDDYYAEVQRVQKQYEDELAIQQKELQKAIDNNKILYDEDWTNYHNATGYKISDTENFATTFRDTLLGSLMGSEEDTANFTDVVNSAVNTLTQGLMQGAEVYYANLQNAMNAAGTSTEDFAKDFEEKIKEIEDKSEESTNKIKDLAKDMSSSLKDITDSVTTWQETYGEVMQQIINSNLDVINSFNDMLEALSIDKNSITVKYDILSDDTKKPEQYASGGYTGKWGNYGKLAILDEKELILNKDDTVNFLDALGIAKQIIDTIDLNALQASYGFGNLVPATINENNSQTIEQDVHITAEFPNATDHNEIEQAFETLINKASQYANRK